MTAIKDTTELTPESDAQRRADLWEPMNGYHQSWYAVALSVDLPAGTSKGVELCDGRLVLWRGDDGDLRATSAWCRHMGADLACGDVVGNNVRCPFHHWQFAGDGACVDIPSGDRIPRAAQLLSLPIEEKWGVVWVWLGEEPAFPVPSFPVDDPARIRTRASVVPLVEPLRVEPWVFATNVFDFAHFRAVHGIAGLNPEVIEEEHVMKWSQSAALNHDTVGETSQSIELWGTNIAVSYGKKGGQTIRHMACCSPMGSQGSVFFLIIGTELTDDSPEADDAATQTLAGLEALHHQLMNEDVPIMNSLRFGRAQFTAADRQLTRYLRWARAYPRTTLAAMGA